MKTYYTVYQTTNHKTGHIYIGTHKTVDVHDSYLGSGTRLANAIRKYGHEFFSKEVLHIFENSEDMFLKEAELVDEEFVKRLDTYNIKTGGYGGWEYINQNRENLTYNWNTKGSSERFKKMHECGDFTHTITDITDEILVDITCLIGVDVEEEIPQILSKEVEKFLVGYIYGHYLNHYRPHRP